MFKWLRREQVAPAPQEAEKIREALQTTRSSWFTRVGLMFQRPQITEELWDELEEALVSADVGLETTGRLLSCVRSQAQQVPGATPEVARSLLRQEMLSLLQAPAGQVPESPPERPWVVLVVGVNGSGKTTTIAKLAADLAGRGNRVLLAAADTFRAAAIEQLQQWGDTVGVDVVAHQQGSDPGAVAFDALEAARARAMDIVLIDTAGRLHTRTNLMEELKKIRRVVQRFDASAPHQVLLVLDATTGQNGVAQATHFTEAVQVTGVVLTKLDGTARGGVVLAIAAQLHLPVVYLGTGEGQRDITPFDPEAFVDALLS